MPVSFCPAKHSAESYASVANESTPLDLLKGACCEEYKQADEVLQSSFENIQHDETIVPLSNGLVNTILEAYNHHHALFLRPDDVWIAILAQFNFYVNGNAEALRSIFVSHEGKKKLEVRALGTRYTVDFGYLANLMTEKLKENIKDPSLVEWIVPKFSTTTTNDVVVSSVLMMSTMKEYFKYQFTLRCGIPKVTLEGIKEDWEILVRRIERLKVFGEEPTSWYQLLHPVLSRFVSAFDDPSGSSNIEFWQKVAHYEGGGSGPTYLCGWITAFCVWNADGKWIGASKSENLKKESRNPKPSDYYKELTLDNATYHYLDTNDIPSAYANVDVKLDDNGKIFATMMVSGLVGMQVSDSKDKELSSSGLKDIVRPVTGWWIFIKKQERKKKIVANDDVRFL